MHILVINYEYPPIGGGGGIVTRDILEHLVKLGHKVSIITTHFEGLEKYEITAGVEIFRVPVLFRNKRQVSSMISLVSYPPSCVLNAFRLLNGRRYDVINTVFAVPSGPAGHILSRVLSLPNVLTIHGGDIFDPSRSFAPHKTPLVATTVQALLNRADRVVASSSDTIANVHRYYKVKRPIDIIPLGITPPTFEKKTRHDFDLDFDETVFCTIGRLIKRKNIDDALQILAEIKHICQFKFIIIGDGPERARIEKLVKHFGLERRVLLLGCVSDEVKFQILELSDCYLSTALHEGFGLVFLEAMACGVPVICYDRGGQNDFLINERTGFLIRLGDKKSFRDRIIRLIRDSELRKKMSIFNKKLVTSYYVSKCAENYVSLFGEAISEFCRKRKYKEAL
ncbi:MAG: glycosyltransferase family 4 protein [Nitrospirota bacterium]